MNAWMWKSSYFWRVALAAGVAGLAILTLSLVLRAEWEHESHLATFIALVGVAGIALVLAWYLTSGLRSTLLQLRDAVDGVSHGTYGHQVYAESSGELGLLVQAFNTMTQNLRTQFTQLNQERQQLRAIFRCMVEGVVVIDAEQHVLFMNDAAARLLRVSIGPSRGRKLWELVRHRQLVEAAETVLASEEPFRADVEWQTPEEQALQIQGAQLIGAPRRGAVLVLHDITHLRRLERLRQDFIADVSHELKTPLACIQAAVETLVDGALHDPVHGIRFFGQIRENVERLDRLVQDLLTLSRIEAGAAAIEIGPLPLAPAIEACLDRHAQRAEAKHQQLVGQVPAPDVVVLADAEALDHILDNLVDNAIKYTPPQGRIELRGTRRSDDVLIEVADNGPGIPEKDLPRVFERFYRVDKARSRELGGTGLGLSIVKHLAQALGSRISAASVVGQGSTFSFSLPLADAAVAAQSAAASEIAAV